MVEYNATPGYHFLLFKNFFQKHLPTSNKYTHAKRFGYFNIENVLAAQS